MAEGTCAGEELQASLPVLPEATTTETPAAVAASTAGVRAAWKDPCKLMLATAGRMLLVAIQSNAAMVEPKWPQPDAGCTLTRRLAPLRRSCLLQI